MDPAVGHHPFCCLPLGFFVVIFLLRSDTPGCMFAMHFPGVLYLRSERKKTLHTDGNDVQMWKAKGLDEGWRKEVGEGGYCWNCRYDAGGRGEREERCACVVRSNCV